MCKRHHKILTFNEHPDGLFFTSFPSFKFILLLKKLPIPGHCSSETYHNPTFDSHSYSVSSPLFFEICSTILSKLHKPIHPLPAFVQTLSLRQTISGYQGNLWMMSCDAAAVPKLTSEGSEHLIFSRE